MRFSFIKLTLFLLNLYRVFVFFVIGVGTWDMDGKVGIFVLSFSFSFCLNSVLLFLRF